MNKFIQLAAVAALGAGVHMGAMAQATYHFWNSAGATAVVDEADTAKYTLNAAGNIGFKGNITYPATIVSRYPVTGIPSNMPYIPGMYMRYADNGANGQVVAKLQRMDYSTGAVTTLATFDSNAHSVTPLGIASTQEYQYLGCLSTYSYATHWIEVTQTKLVAGNTDKAALFNVMLEYQTTPQSGCRAAEEQKPTQPLAD